MSAGDDVVLTLTGEGTSSRGISGIKHPLAILFHLLFRTSALLVYLFCSWFSNSFITCFITIIIFISMDFWTVKNVTGRLLVGLRWWNYVDDVGGSHWIYESREAPGNIGKVNRYHSASEIRIFWIALVASQSVWSFFFFTALISLSLKWIMVVIVGWGLNAANLYGYIRCRWGAKKDVSDVAKDFLGRQVIGSMLAGFGKRGQENAGPDFPTN